MNHDVCICFCHMLECRRCEEEFLTQGDNGPKMVYLMESKLYLERGYILHILSSMLFDLNFFYKHSKKRGFEVAIFFNSPFACFQQASRRCSSFVCPVVKTGSARDRGSFRVCLISTTCLPVTRGSLPRSGVERGRKWR